MELFLLVLSVLGLVCIGFLIAEFQNAYLGKQEKGSKQYFSFIGVIITQKDIQRLLFAIFLSIGIMVALPQLIQFTGYDINAYIVYLITGYAPSTVMFFIKKKVKGKTEK
ncbi:MAG: hypothetical protein QQN55_08075 [Nitrosopumilus sp.]